MTGAVIRGYRGVVPPRKEFLFSLPPKEDFEVLLFLDAGVVAGREHLERALELALRRWEEGRGTLRDLSLEVLLFVLGERQIQTATARSFPPEGVGEWGALSKSSSVERASELVEFVARRWGWKRDDSVLEIRPEKLVRLGISPSTIRSFPTERLLDLVLEHVALTEAL